MSNPTYRIPKLSDRDLIAALFRIRNQLSETRTFKVTAQLPHVGGVQVEPNNPEGTGNLKAILELNGRGISQFSIGEASKHAALIVYRKPELVYDEAALQTEYWNSFSNEERQSIGPLLNARLSTLVQKELRCDELQASFSGAEDTAWNRFREAQIAVLNSLQQTNQHLLIDSAKEIRTIREEEHRKNEEIRERLKRESEAHTSRLTAEHEERLKTLSAREEALAKQLADFETKESKYVARQEAKKQLDQLKEWLKDSSLTEKTVRKRRPVFIGYIVAIVTTGLLTAWLSYENVQLLKAAGTNLPQVPWWQWLGLTLKTVVPLGAFVTFLIYFIRWEADWARQHSDEELRTRARVVDIGRSSWLMEAVRDSKESKDPIPKELLEQLSKNLFTNTTSDTSELHPKSGAEVLMSQLSSLRLKSPDGAEVEATTGGAKK